MECVICHGPGISKCSGCKNVYYCSRDCQRVDYPEHRKRCAIYSIRDTHLYGQGMYATRPISAGTHILRDTYIKAMHEGKPINFASKKVQTITLLVPAESGDTTGDRLIRAIQHTGIKISDKTHAIFPIVRFTNHSCTPNARMSIPDVIGNVSITAIKDIPQDAEITLSYIPSNYCSFQTRRGHLPFKCLCEACTNRSDDDYRSKSNTVIGIIAAAPHQPSTSEVIFFSQFLAATTQIAGGPHLDSFSETVLEIYIARWIEHSRENERFSRDIRQPLIDALESVLYIYETLGNTHVIMYGNFVKTLAALRK